MSDPVLLLEIAALLVLIGALGGFLSGLLGVGGGMIYVPALFFAFQATETAGEHAMHMAVGTSLAVVMMTVASSARAHGKNDNIEKDILKEWGPAIVLGVIIGTLVAGSVDGKILKEAFAVLTMAVAIFMAFGKDSADGKKQKWLTDHIQRFFCTLIGIAAALTGMGGAVLTVPMMIVRGLPTKRALGTGTALGLLIATPAMFGYAMTGYGVSGLPPFSIGYVNAATVLFLMPLSVIFAPIGVKVAQKTDRVLLRRIFSGVVLIVSLRMFLSL